MLLIGSAGLILSIFLFYSLATLDDSSYMGPYIYGALLVASPASIVLGIIFFIPGLLILRKISIGWWLAIIIFLIITAIVIIAIIWDFVFSQNYKYYNIVDLFYYSLVVIPLIPFVILLRERKNFYKNAS